MIHKCNRCGKTYNCVNLDINGIGDNLKKPPYPCKYAMGNEKELVYCVTCPKCGGIMHKDSICFDIGKIKKLRPDLYNIALREMGAEEERLEVSELKSEV